MGGAVGEGCTTDHLVPVVEGIDPLDGEKRRCQERRRGGTRPEPQLPPGGPVKERTRIDDEAPAAGDGSRRRLEDGPEEGVLLPGDLHLSRVQPGIDPEGALSSRRIIPPFEGGRRPGFDRQGDATAPGVGDRVLSGEEEICRDGPLPLLVHTRLNVVKPGRNGHGRGAPRSPGAGSYGWG